MNKGIVYQFDKHLVLIGQYTSLLDAERATGISYRTISNSIVRRVRCREMFFFSRNPVMVPVREYLDEPLGLSITLKLPKSLGEEFLLALKHRNKQEILRKLCRDWVNQQKQIDNAQSGD